MEKSNTTVDEYLESLEEPSLSEMTRMDDLIHGVLAGWSRCLWVGRFWGGTDQEIIGYGDYSYQKGNGETVEWFVAGLAQQKNHLSVYVNVADDGKYLGQVYGKRLGKVKLGAASIGFASVDDLDAGVFAEMLHRARELSPNP